jgi:hypothetical protein
VRVQVDEAGRHELAGGVDTLRAPISGNRWRDHRDLTELDPDVPFAAQLLARVQHLASGDDELVLKRGVSLVEATRGGSAGLRDEDRTGLRLRGTGQR